MNGFLQQGVGRFLKGRLKRYGCHLDDQTVNQSLAKRAFAEGYSTLDLESASDTLSLEVVRFLIPDRYFEFFSDLRCEFTDIGGGRHVRLEKFSSMGNAFTFELESLVFFALSRAVKLLMGVDHKGLSVFGDDIIVPREIANETVQGLALLGFSVNKAKSFIDGPFFESCGKHYFKGVDVTPCLVTKPILGTFDAIRVHNKLLRWSVRVHDDFLSPHIARSLAVVRWPDYLRFKQPYGEPDIGYFSLDSFPFCPNRGFKLEGLEERSLLRPSSDLALFAYKLRRPTHSNSHPKGWSFEDTPGRVAITKRWWPVTLFDVNDIK
jgi:hypothetical protein